MTQDSIKHVGVGGMKGAILALRNNGWIIDEKKGTGYHPNEPTATLKIEDIVRTQIKKSKEKFPWTSADRIVSPEIDSENERRRFLSVDFTKNGKTELVNSDDVFAKLNGRLKTTQFESEKSADQLKQEMVNEGVYQLGTGDGHVTVPNGWKPPKKTVDEAALFKIQNVRDLLMDNQSDDKLWEPDFIFCARLPYPIVVFSYDHEFLPPEDPRNQQRKIRRHMNVRMERCDRAEFQQVVKAAELPASDVNELMHIVERREPDSFIKTHISADGMSFPGCWFLMVDESDHVLTDKFHDQNWLWIRDPLATSRVAGFYDKYGVEMQDGFARHGMICLNAIQFLNCRNVEIVDNPPSRQQRRQAERQGTKPPVTYKTLVIHAMRRRGATSGDSEGSHAGMPVHTVRGHFKDFRSGPGLGRAHSHGIYWWEPMLRGSAEHGRVVKDYEVEAEAQ